MIASPTPQSNFSKAPRTNIVEDGVEEDDRFAVLPKLSVALSRVNELLSNLVQRGQEQGNCSKDYSEDHKDFASGIVNTSRGEVRSGPRNRASQQDNVASLLGTYLAAASLGSTASSNGEKGSGATSSLARLLQ